MMTTPPLPTPSPTLTPLNLSTPSAMPNASFTTVSPPLSLLTLLPSLTLSSAALPPSKAPLLALSFAKFSSKNNLDSINNKWTIIYLIKIIFEDHKLMV
ncbi:hypothetical protein AHAS_Ahas16G0202800 [Arachis hypogaea]